MRGEERSLGLEYQIVDFKRVEEVGGSRRVSKLRCSNASVCDWRYELNFFGM